MTYFLYGLHRSNGDVHISKLASLDHTVHHIYTEHVFCISRSEVKIYRRLWPTIGTHHTIFDIFTNTPNLVSLGPTV